MLDDDGERRVFIDTLNDNSSMVSMRRTNFSSAGLAFSSKNLRRSATISMHFRAADFQSHTTTGANWCLD